MTKKHNVLSVKYEGLKHLKNNMSEYLGRDKAEKKKESVISVIENHKAEDKEKVKKEFER